MENEKLENNEQEELKQSQEKQDETEKEISENTESQHDEECGCALYTEINYIPNEYFYNSCDCDTCGCITEEEMICSCGYTDDTMDAHSSC